MSNSNIGWETSDTDQVEHNALYGVDLFEQTDLAIEDIEQQITQRC